MCTMYYHVVSWCYRKIHYEIKSFFYRFECLTAMRPEDGSCHLYNISLGDMNTFDSIEVADIRSYHCNEGEFLTDLPSVNSHASIVKDKKFPLSKFDLEWEKKAKIAHIFTNFHQLRPIWNLTPLPAAAGSQVWFITNAVQCLSPITTSNQLRHRYILFYML